MAEIGFRGSFEERFWRKVKKEKRGCWIWIGARLLNGYGNFNVRNNLENKSYLAHRLSYKFCRGKIPKNLCLDHLCRNRICVNPKHLEPVTIKVNILRGIGIGAKNAVKTRCKRGHEFTKKNTYKNKKSRACRICIYQANKKYLQNKKT